MFVWIQFGKGMAGCRNMRLFNRESPRILANRIFLAPPCSASADRLRRIARRLEKCWGKTGVPVFLSVNFSFCETNIL